MPLIYPRLRAIAGSLKRDEPATSSLPATALVHEVYLRPLNQRRLGWDDREHFFSFSAQVMRLILSDHARARLASKRGGAAVRVPVHEVSKTKKFSTSTGRSTRSRHSNCAIFWAAFSRKPPRSCVIRKPPQTATWRWRAPGCSTASRAACANVDPSSSYVPSAQ